MAIAQDIHAGYLSFPPFELFLSKASELIVIEKVLVSDDVIEQQFVCDLSRCKGGCCEDGDAGAPLTEEELDEVVKAWEVVRPMMSEQGVREVETRGMYHYDREFGWVTPTIDGGICAYGVREGDGTIKCVFEAAQREGKIGWRKPISCHLYPIKTKRSRYNGYEMVNYEPREVMCAPGCSLGASLKVPVYTFLKDAIVRKYGIEFYELLDRIARERDQNQD